MRLYGFGGMDDVPFTTTVMPDGHSGLEPLLPIPNRTVKRASADDSADSRVKVGHCQAIYPQDPLQRNLKGVLFYGNLSGSMGSVFIHADTFAGLKWVNIWPDVDRWLGLSLNI